MISIQNRNGQFKGISYFFFGAAHTTASMMHDLNMEEISPLPKGRISYKGPPALRYSD
jgi:hypothetical protein